MNCLQTTSVCQMCAGSSFHLVRSLQHHSPFPRDEVRGKRSQIDVWGWPLSGLHVPAAGAQASRLVHTQNPPSCGASFPEHLPSLVSALCHSLPGPDLPKMTYFFLPSFVSLTSWPSHVDCAAYEPFAAPHFQVRAPRFLECHRLSLCSMLPRGTSRIPLPSRSFPVDMFWTQQVPWFL